MIRVLVVDDHQMIIDGIKLMLKEDDDIQCVAEAAHGEEAMRILHEVEVDLVLLDINMPVLNGIDTCAHILKRFPKIKVIAMSMFSEISYIEQMMKKGASGYLLKNSSLSELLGAIHKVMQDGRYYSKEVMDVVIDNMKGIRTGTHGTHKVIPKISKREKQILQLILDEKTTQEIADELFISFFTVETHRRNLMKKLGVKNSVGLVKMAIEYRILEN